MIYNKPWISYSDQLDKLKARGLIVTDDKRALAYLERVGYYRLSGYLYSFRERSGICCPLATQGSKKFKKGNTNQITLETFKPSAKFGQAVDLYVFDKRLRLLVLDALERIEIALRVDIAHTLGQHDSLAYLKPELLHPEFANTIDPKTGLTKLHKWQESHARLINRSREAFIQHYKVKYGLPIPLWIACEVWDFGTLSTLYAGLRTEEQDAVSTKYGITNGRVFASWLRSLNYLRNVCAHHSRLWNRNMTDQPKKPNLDEVPLFGHAWDNGNGHIQARPFLLLCITQYLLTTINPSSSWWQRLTQLLIDFPDLENLGLNLKGMGVIDNWQTWNWNSGQ